MREDLAVSIRHFDYINLMTWGEVDTALFCEEGAKGFDFGVY